MNLRQLTERTQALNLIWERKIGNLLKLKPTAVLEADDIVSLQEATSASPRTGVPTSEVSELWANWVQTYVQIQKQQQEMEQKYGMKEFEDVFGVTAPLAED
jgi:hypothetical protein